MKKLKFIIVLIIILLSFSSCISSDTEIKNRLIIEGIGIDYNNKSDEYILTVQALSMVSASSGDENSPKSPVVNFTVSGKTVAQALNSLCENTGRTPLYSQNRVILIGSELDSSRIASALDYLVREYTARPDVCVAACVGSAADILKIQANGEIPSKIIEESINESNKNSIGQDSELYNLVNLYQEKTTAFTMSLLEIDKQLNTESDCVKVTGTFVLDKNNKKNHLSSEETVMLKFITDDIETGTLSLTCDGTKVGVDIIGSKTKIKTDIKDDKPYFDINVKCSVDLVEYGDPNFKSVSDEIIEKIRVDTEKYIASGMTELLERQLKKEKSDIFRFGKRLELSYTHIYEILSEDWQNSMSDIDYNISVNATVRKIGQETLRS